MTAVEAMACGTPTVITTHGGLYRAITFGRHALYADAFDKEDLGISIVKILRHPRLAHRLARMGAHKARSLFTWTGIAQQLVSLISQDITLFAGDIILCGTSVGVGSMKPGSTIEVEIAGIGKLSNRFE
jgi:mannosylfructose-phosphate synthase